MKPEQVESAEGRTEIHACASVNSTVQIHGIIRVCGCWLASMLASMPASVHAGVHKKAREHALELFQKNEHVHSFQNACEHARKLFYFWHSFSQSQQYNYIQYDRPLFMEI